MTKVKLIREKVYDVFVKSGKAITKKRLMALGDFTKGQVDRSCTQLRKEKLIGNQKYWHKMIHEEYPVCDSYWMIRIKKDNGKTKGS